MADRARPPSASHFGLTLIALGAALLVLWALAPWHRPLASAVADYALLLPCFAVLIVIGAGERLWPRLQPQPQPQPLALARMPLRPLSWQRVGLRLWGLAATILLVAFGYWLLPEYHGSFYLPYWRFLRALAPLAVLVPVYFVWADRRLEHERDEYHEFGALLLGRHDVHWHAIAQHLLGWLIKAFFLPLMVVYLGNEVHALYVAYQGPLRTQSLYPLFYHLAYAIDLLFCVVGYSATTRLFDAHIRSVEPTVGGWLAALVCYQPFYSVLAGAYLQYDDHTYWDNWLQSWPLLQACWGSLIIALSLIYALCTVAFGLRFSNLTHRGIITAGPYRFSKHPAYLSKNVSWWLISVPFVSEQGWGAAVRNSCLLLLLNAIYFARARTEERHLSRDPRYVAYALWMEQHGLLRRLARRLPFLRYRAPRTG